MSENQITKEIAEVILALVNKPKYPDLKDILVKEYHISRRMLNPEKLLSMGGVSFFRLMMALYQNVTEREFKMMLDAIRDKTVMFAELEDGSPEAVILAHAGSPINRQH